MVSSLPRTALPGRSRSASDVLARNLGYFSIALGGLELLAPKMVCRAAGLTGREGLVRSYGVREIAQGVVILGSHDPTPWVWGRVAGDALDIVTVWRGSRGGSEGRRGAAATALMTLVAVTAIDLLCAQKASLEKGGPKTAVADYSDRSGFPKGLAAARGAARAKTPDASASSGLVLADDGPASSNQSAAGAK
jgi:hypothetical protein